MSQEELDKRIDAGWINVGRFSEISTSSEIHRQFLEAIPKFKMLEKQGLVTETGVDMPNCGTIIIGKVVAVDVVPDYSVDYIGGSSAGLVDGNIIVLQAQK